MCIIKNSIYLIYFSMLINAQLFDINKNSNAKDTIRINAYDNKNFNINQYDGSRNNNNNHNNNNNNYNNNNDNNNVNYNRMQQNIFRSNHNEQINNRQKLIGNSDYTQNNFKLHSTLNLETTTSRQSRNFASNGRNNWQSSSDFSKTNNNRQDYGRSNSRDLLVGSNSAPDETLNYRSSKSRDTQITNDYKSITTTNKYFTPNVQSTQRNLNKNDQYNFETTNPSYNSELQYTNVISTTAPKYNRRTESSLQFNSPTAQSNHDRSFGTISPTIKMKTRTKSSFRIKLTTEKPLSDTTYLTTIRASKYNRYQDRDQSLNNNTPQNIKNTNESSKKIAQKRISQRKYEEYMIKLFGDDDSEEGNMFLTTRNLDGREIVEPGEYPHMAAIGFMTTNNTIDWKCGGSLISDYFIITAAHCCDFSGQRPSHIKIGDINLKVKQRNSVSQKMIIDKIFKHPLYRSDSYYNDIALLKLNMPAVFTNFVRPIRLWDKSLIPYDTVYAMGYGSTAFGKSKTNVLTDLNLTIVENPECNQNLPKIPETNVGIIESQMCAIDKIGNRDTCQGDSGGPLQLNLLGKNRLRYHLVGITSFGVLCGGDHPSVYTRISSFIDWIEKIVWSET